MHHPGTLLLSQLPQPLLLLALQHYWIAGETDLARTP
jgi:hypothetical protein